MISSVPRTGRRGNAMVEFALAAPLLVSIVTGTFQFGYTFFVYNQLQSAVRAGARYGSLRDYQSDGASCVTAVKDSVRNMVVYGTPAPDAGASPIVRGFSTSNVTVDFAPDAKGVPTIVSVSVNAFTIDGLFAKFTLTGKPFAQVPYSGRYAPSECP
jgi:Flp pilus assembly protein TadG